MILYYNSAGSRREQGNRLLEYLDPAWYKLILACHMINNIIKWGKVMKARTIATCIAGLIILCSAMCMANSEPLGFTPLDSTSPMLSPDPHITSEATTGADYVNSDSVANVSSIGYSADAETGGPWIIVGVGTVQVGYKRMFTQMTMYRPGYNGSNTYEADVYNIKWAPNRHIKALPANGQLSVGSIMYFERTSQNDYNFQQHYASLGFDFNDLRLKAGYNWTEGRMAGNDGLFASMQWEFTDNWMMFVDYSDKDFNKIVVNDVYLPRLGFDCTDCRDDSTNVGITTRFEEKMYATLGMFDAQDIQAIMGSLSVKWDY